jgi:hypothetical protein
MNTPTVLTPDSVSGLITVTGGYTPTDNIHEPDSTYAQFYIVPVIGPLCYLTWKRLNMWLPDTDQPITLGYDELAWSLGAAPSRLGKAISRLVKFHLAYITPAQPDMLYVKQRAPTLSTALLAGLAVKCPTLVEAHAEQLITAD